MGIQQDPTKDAELFFRFVFVKKMGKINFSVLNIHKQPNVCELTLTDESFQIFPVFLCSKRDFSVI